MKLNDEIRNYLTELAKRGGKARAKALTQEQRKAIATKASQGRWKGLK